MSYCTKGTMCLYRQLNKTTALSWQQPSAQSSALYSALKNFFQKEYTHAGRMVNTTLPACHIYYFTLQIYKSSAQNYQNAEDTALLYYIEDITQTER